MLDSDGRSYRGHGNLALETPTDGIVNTLGLAPSRRHTLEAVRLVAVEAVGAYMSMSVLHPYPVS